MCYRMLDTYNYTSAPPMNVPIYCFGGSFDSNNIRDMWAWAVETRASTCPTLLLPGGTFYLQDHENQVLLH
ncbi:unnamed protein product, partial [Choristocarpus tenellus]